MQPTTPVMAKTSQSSLLYSRRNFLMLCLGFLGSACASAGSTTEKSSIATPHPPQATATVSAAYHGVYTGHTGEVWEVSWSPDGTRIASASADGTVQVWDPLTGRTLLTYKGHADIVQAVAWSPDGMYIASTGGDTTVQIWDAATGALHVTCRGHADDVLGVAWSPDSRHISSGSDDRTARVWDASNGKLLLTYQGHSSFVKQVPWSPDGRRIASASDDGTVQVWDVANGRTQLSLSTERIPRWAAAWSPDGTRIASAFGNDVHENGKEAAHIWNATSGRILLTYNGHGTSSNILADGVLGLAWTPDGKHLASGGADKTVQIWDAQTGHRLLMDNHYAGPVWTVAWSPDGKRLAAGSWDATVAVWQPPI